MTRIGLPLSQGDLVTLNRTQTLTNKLISTGSALDANASENFTYHSMERQLLRNGNCDIAQRGTSIANTTENSYTLDQWYVDTATAGDDKTVSQQTADVAGSLYSIRVQRVNGETGHTVLRLSQAIESRDSIKFRGKKLTLSFYGKVGANFSAASSILTAKILTGKGTDEKATAFTTSADAISSDITATTTSVKYTLTTTDVIASDITQIGVSFSYDPTGTAGANDWFELTQIQLCAGDVALPFQAKSFAEELRDCQRFFQMYTSAVNAFLSWGVGCSISTTQVVVLFPFVVNMRYGTITMAKSAAAQFAVSEAAVASASAVGLNDYCETHANVIFTSASLTVAKACRVYSNNDVSTYLSFSAEL